MQNLIIKLLYINWCECSNTPFNNTLYIPSLVLIYQPIKITLNKIISNASPPPPKKRTHNLEQLKTQIKLHCDP